MSKASLARVLTRQACFLFGVGAVVGGKSKLGSRIRVPGLLWGGARLLFGDGDIPGN